MAAARSRTPQAAAAAPSRLGIPKPGRAARELQLRAKVTEFCSLRFDEVDTTEQMGLTCRMLATLKSFAQDVSYWKDDGSKHDEAAFSLLGLDKVAEFAAWRAAERAEALVEERCWREAYTELCAARPWLPSECHSGPSEEQRAEAMAEMGRVEERVTLERADSADTLFTKDSSDSGAESKSPATDGSLSVVMLLPEGGTGRVIGPRAATVTALQAETGARVWLSRTKSEAHISGTPEAVEAAKRGIQFLLTPLKDTEAGTLPPSATPHTPNKEVMCRFFKNGVCNKGSECHFLHSTASQQSQSDDEETRASTDEEPLGATSTAGKDNGDKLPIRSRTGSGSGGKASKGASGSLGLSGLWQECPDVAYRVQAQSDFSWTCVVCGAGNRSGTMSKKEPISFDEAAGVYWLGTSKGYVAVRSGMDRLDWYLAEDQERSQPAFTWLRQQRASPKQAPRRSPTAA